MRTLQQVDSSTSCGVWGTSLRLSAPHAALVNGTLVHGFELDDIHRLGVMHVGAVTLPSLLAVTENQTGDERTRLFSLPRLPVTKIGPRDGKVHGRGTYWPGVALRSDRWSVLIGGSGGSRIAALKGADGPCVRNRRHAVFGPHGCPVWFHGLGGCITGRSAQSGL